MSLDHLSQEQREALVKQALQVLQETQETQEQASLERQDPRVLLARQVIQEALGLLDPQGLLE